MPTTYANTIEPITAIMNEYNTMIFSSFMVKSRREMKSILKQLQSMTAQHPELAIHRRSISDMTREWCVHNLLYSLGIQQHRTSSVDLDYPQSRTMKMLYAIGSIFYFHR